MKAPGRNYLLVAGVLYIVGTVYAFVTTYWPLWQVISHAERIHGARAALQQHGAGLYVVFSVASIAWTLTIGMCFVRFNNRVEKSELTIYNAFCSACPGSNRRTQEQESAV